MLVYERGEGNTVENLQMILAIINIAAIIIIPIAAVFTGQLLQNRSQKRDDKLNIFKILMVNRYGWSAESVRAMNILEIVFADDECVLKAWRDFYDKSCINNPDEMQIKKMQTAKDKLLEAMAQSLGYREKITWETIQNPYIPKGMADAMEQQQVIQTGQVELAKAAGIFAQMIDASAGDQQFECRQVKNGEKG